METYDMYDIIIHSAGCSGPGTSEIWVAVLDGEELTRHRAPLYAAAQHCWLGVHRRWQRCECGIRDPLPSA
jgi:hypothetical protein